MYINIKNLFNDLPNPFTLPLLLVLKQASKKDLTEHVARLITSDSDLDLLIEQDYIKLIKGKKNDDMVQRLRLGKKGTSFLNSLDDAEVEDQDRQFGLWLTELYKSKGKTIKSGKKLLRLIAWFREVTEIDKNKLAYLLKCFMQEMEDTDFKYSHDVNNVFWKPTNLFQTKPSLEDSRLYAFYISNKEKMDKEFEKY